ncbi:unnamed protein product, partial [Prorocentrum cordatum]
SGWPSPLPALHAGRRRRGRGGAPQGSARARKGPAPGARGGPPGAPAGGPTRSRGGAPGERFCCFSLHEGSYLGKMLVPREDTGAMPSNTKQRQGTPSNAKQCQALRPCNRNHGYLFPPLRERPLSPRKKIKTLSSGRGGRPEGGGRVLVSGGRGETKVSSSSRRRRRSCTSYKHTAPISPRMSVDFRMLAPGVLRSALGPLEASPAPPLARSACQEKGASVDP